MRIYETPEIAVVGICTSETVANDNEVILSAGNIFPPQKPNI